MFDNKETFKSIFQRNLVSKLGKPIEEATKEDVYHVLGSMIREYVGQDWAASNQGFKQRQDKQVYYFSLEFLIGRLLGNNLLNVNELELVRDSLAELGFSLECIEEQEADAGLGNGGLGRLAACFLDSLASLGYAGHGCGIRYKYGLFEQKIINGNQVELPDNWLDKGNEWEVRRPDKKVEVQFWGRVEAYEQDGHYHFVTKDAESVVAVPYDVPVIGYGQSHVNTLRLWSAEPKRETSLDTPSNYYGYLDYSRSVESISEFLYPDDSQYEGKLLRLKQQYFMCSAGVQSALRTFSKLGLSYDRLPDKVAFHINDTHPTLVIPELMRILMDDKGYGWDEAWDITTRTVSYTNHTTLSEALEKWPVSMVSKLLPRIYMIIEEINKRFCGLLLDRYPGDGERIEHMAIIANDQVRMAHLAIVGSHSVNGVAALHTEILKEREMAPFYALYPERFNNKTNGITHRRWLMHANPKLSNLITETIGNEWVTEPGKLEQLADYADQSAFQEQFRAIKRDNKNRLASYILDHTGVPVDPDSVFDVQVKRLHGYKRQLLNILHVMHLYNKLKSDASFDMVPRTFIFGAKAAPSYYFAKKIIKLINTVSDTVNRDAAVNDRLKVFFLENYSVSLAEKIIPAADVSEQISTAGKEASGTGNMKFMMNGALTIGTMDGANVEMAEQVGEENMFIYGLRADEVLEYYRNGNYRPNEIVDQDERIREVVEQLVHPGAFCYRDGEFWDIYDSLLAHGDEYFVLRDFAAYADAHVAIDQAYRDISDWTRKAVLNTAHSGIFSSDRTISEYATDIWGIHPVSGHWNG
ncbi:starch phosphorylase [Paenibacillus polysaccharolyticus]|uniref:Alpha-1,4 glucan phosphorylase n=1 Tax=Paenibacillus polysaccharolyticus TaxID=582692 RepID=A0A1G5IN09_9BACL|nr:glycogen/starch/alpha-glucan phosphorylase [Paenibacillus polysaccharolyticus]SCY77452.1 starch phosphorylase [Paenibacillus polysaccharolyticus]